MCSQSTSQERATDWLTTHTDCLRSPLKFALLYAIILLKAKIKDLSSDEHRLYSFPNCIISNDIFKSI